MNNHLQPVGRLQQRLFYALLLAAIVAVQLWRGALTTGRWFCVDEFEHLHASWCIAHGMVPYRDFFEHHTPLLYVLLAPIIKIMRPEQSYDAALRTILICRWIIWILSALILWLVYRLGREIHSRAAGVMAVIFTLSTMMFVERSTEIRPDMLSVPAMLACLVLTMRGLRTASRRSVARLGAAGLIAGLGILASPKSLFWGAGFAVALCWAIADGRFRGMRLRMLAASVAGAVAPLAITLGIMAFFGAADDLVRDNFILNSQWKFRLNPWEKIGELAYENPCLAAFGMVGLVAAIAVSIRTGAAARMRLVPAFTLVSLIIGIFIIPVPYTEYFMMPIVLLAIYEAATIVRGIGMAARLCSERPTRRRSFAIPAASTLAAIAAFAFVLIHYRPPFVRDWQEFAAWMAVLCAIAITSAFRWRYAAMLLLVSMMVLFPLRRLVKQFPQSPETNEQSAQRAALAYVHQHSAPTETVFDGWAKITAPFRPHAWYYYFLHREIRPIVPAEKWAELHRDLAEGRIAPKLVIMDEDTRALPAEIVRYFEEHYRPGAGDIWVRREREGAE